MIPSADFGPGSLSTLGKKAKSMGLRKPLIVCDTTIVSLGIAEKVATVIRSSGLEAAIFDKCTENPKVEEITDGAKSFEGAGCDCVIGLGGGSSMDAARVIRVVAKHGGTATDYDALAGGFAKIPPDLPSMISIPTTAGTGSEASIASVITDTKKKVKFVVASPALISTAVILDPELTLSLPPRVTAATGLDALIHAIEAFVSNIWNPMGETFCRSTFELVGESLKSAVKDGNNIEMRTNMQLAAFYGGICLTLKGLGAVHALAHPLGGHFGIPHGSANAIMLPAVMKFNAQVAKERYLEVVNRMGFKADTISQATEALTNLTSELGLPTRLSEVGVQESHLEQLSIDASKDLCLKTNPVTCGRDELLRMYRDVL